MDKVECNKNKTKRCNELQYDTNVKCTHYEPHIETYGCCGNEDCDGVKVKCKPCKD